MAACVHQRQDYNCLPEVLDSSVVGAGGVIMLIFNTVMQGIKSDAIKDKLHNLD